nr:hypothetical protein [Eggerthella sinensis]
MPQPNKQSQFQQPSPRTTIISVILFMLVAFFVGQQFMNMSSSSATPTDRLITSEFVQAVEQDRATKVVYNAGDYTVSGSYYPAITAGSTGADAFNEAFQALNARMATLKNPETGKRLAAWAPPTSSRPRWASLTTSRPPTTAVRWATSWLPIPTFPTRCRCRAPSLSCLARCCPSV